MPAFRTCLCVFGKKLGGSCTFVFIPPRLLSSPEVLWQGEGILKLLLFNLRMISLELLSHLWEQVVGMHSYTCKACLRGSWLGWEERKLGCRA